MHIADMDLTNRELAELEEAAAVVARLPRDQADRMIRHLLRVALYHRRTKDDAALRSAAESLLTTVARAEDASYQQRVRQALSQPHGGQTIDAQSAIEALRTG